MISTRLISFALLSALLVACSSEPPPPKNGPNGSWWVGGSDGGAYVFVEEEGTTNDNLFRGAVYFDSDQSLWYQGRFAYDGPKGFDYRDRSRFLGWDGEGIILTENAYLKAIDPVPPL